MALNLLLFVAGGVLLVGGAEILVRGASKLALAAGLTPLVVGLTVVAFGTSAPEFAVTVGSSWAGASAVAVGNVVGSNIFNILFILGASALIAPLVVETQLVRFEVPLMIGASFLALLLGLDGEIGRVDGLILLAGLAAYTGRLLMRGDGPESEGAPAEDTAPRPGKTPILPQLGMILAGLVLLVIGAGWFVDAAVRTATALGVSELVIGLTIVAGGTSLPEVATSILASIRGQRDIAVGNVIGSNIFNLLGVLGLAGVMAPGGLPLSLGVLTFDIPIMIVVAVATLPLFFTGYLLARWEGALFLAYYVAYTTWLILDSTDHHVLDEFGFAMIGFVIPLTVVTLCVTVWRSWQGRAARAQESP